MSRLRCMVLLGSQSVIPVGTFIREYQISLFNQIFGVFAHRPGGTAVPDRPGGSRPPDLLSVATSQAQKSGVLQAVWSFCRHKKPL